MICHRALLFPRKQNGCPKRLIHFPLIPFSTFSFFTAVALGFFSLTSLSLIPAFFIFGLTSSSSSTISSSNCCMSCQQGRLMKLTTYIKCFFHVWHIPCCQFLYRRSKIGPSMECHRMFRGIIAGGGGVRKGIQKVNQAHLLVNAVLVWVGTSLRTAASFRSPTPSSTSVSQSSLLR